jgi:HD-like signal output (HDOD) protein
VFGRARKTDRDKPSLTAELLSGLQPFATVSAAEREKALSMAAFRQIPPGLIAEPAAKDRHAFLLKGSLQIQTRTGSMIRLKAATPSAGFPLPGPEEMISVYATEACVLLSTPFVAQSAEVSIAAGDNAVEMTPAETAALAELRTRLSEKKQELPSLPDLALKISQAIDSKETSNDDIARLMQLDPALATRILSVVNSSAFGGVTKITSIQQAVSRLGRNKVRSLVYSCLLKSIFKIQMPSLKKTMEALWQHSAHVAALSYVLGRQTPGIDPEQAMLAGLVHDIGAIAAIDGISRYSVLVERAEVLEYAIETLRTDLGIKTVEHWGLRGELGNVIEHAEHWQRIGSAIPDNTDIVLLAQMHALIGTPRFSRLPRIHEIPAFAKLTNAEMTPRQSLKLLEEAASEVREVHALISAG